MNDGIKLEVIEGLANIPKIRGCWEFLYNQSPLKSLDANIKRFLAVSNIFDTRQPFIVALRKGADLEGLLIGHLSSDKSVAKLGYTKISLPRLRTWTIEYGGILGVADSDIMDYMSDVLRTIRRKYRIDSIFLNHIHYDTYKYLNKNFHTVIKKEMHRTMNCMESLDCFYKKFSSKHRKAIKSLLRKAEKLAGFEMRTLSSNSDLEEFIKDAQAVSKKTYQYALGAGLNNIEVLKKLYVDSRLNGWLDFNIAYIKKRPVAFQIGHVVNEVYYLDALGFDPKYGKMSIGTVLFIKVLERLISLSRLKIMDFGFGDAEYKRRYSDNSWEEISFELYSLSIKSMCVYVLRTITSFLDGSFKFLSDKIGMTSRIKKIWRDVLRAK